ncbi:NADH:ubiquinone reductase (Na(+)-transporting) subunit C [Bacteroidales bacterium OttesenSCG-928-B11]|nr:NADH:ubiquinone reductase (Na(+)-transporting) subunit C [Bacteroidales bacterium OttesenSCG-928-B11]MDL2326600.1 NADH:ubiquinone reductase (Na(+)-transporting) subunit C [Bacteroidales bacterium OttesenSCG-928-A14]
MKKFSNRYIILYITVLVAVVALLLSVVSIGLQPRQEQNRNLEKMTQILQASGFKNLDREQVPALFAQVVEEMNVAQESSSELLPLYLVQHPDSTFTYVISLEGNGLWGPIWGYMAIAEDLNTVTGVVFDHKSETPGLGAEITEAGFSSQFSGKMLFDEAGNFTSIKVVKGGVLNSKIDPKHAVDAISGGTITCQSVEEMIQECAGKYVAVFKKLREEERRQAVKDRKTYYKVDN